ncbi:hypothetical protein AYK20_04145 [Thermoplasmatales archaeon SG8-52-1]|nr:MAG: hypothetical protein AYK20_04145 [Thermoplasmatales archaeon SG8-52-1]
MNKKILIAGLLVSVILIVPINSAYSNIDIQIDNKPVITSVRGNILYVGGNGSGNYSKIQDAIDDAVDGDTVFVYDDSAPYKEWEILVNKSINLVGENKNSTVIYGWKHDVLKVTADWVNISGFTITYCDLGIEVCYAYKIKISDNDFIDCDLGIRVIGASNIKISDNDFSDCNFGIFFYATDESSIISNMFRDFLKIAIRLQKCWEIRVSDNIIISTSDGYFKGDIDCFQEGTYLMITNNTLINCDSNDSKNGLLLQGVCNSIIKGNKISGYGVREGGAFAIWGNFNNTISYNTFINNNYGINFIFSSSANKITNNNFINNKFDTFSPEGYFRNLWDGNYWDKWIGNKIKLPLFQKFPKFITSGYIFIFNIDWNPAKEPYDI